MESDAKPPGAWKWVRIFIIGRHPAWTVFRLALLVILGALLFWTIRPIRVDGVSMEPTYTDGQLHVLYRQAFRNHSPERGDVVGINYVQDYVLLLKRIVGLPGETVA